MSFFGILLSLSRLVCYSAHSLWFCVVFVGIVFGYLVPFFSVFVPQFVCQRLLAKSVTPPLLHAGLSLSRNQAPT